MPKFLLSGSYTQEGVKGVLKDGGSKRVKVVKKLCESLGGKLETMYFAFGDDDFFTIIEGPDNIGTIAATMLVNASGAVKVKTTVLIDPKEMDKATKISAAYSAPGK